MRFDLEIPVTHNSEFTFIKEEKDIPNGTVPLLYCKNETINLFPSQFISAEVGYYPKEFIPGGYDTVQGPEIFNPKADLFLITDIKKYSAIEGYNIPIFFKHIIDEPVNEESIKVIDFFGSIINKDIYIIETKDDITNIYINKQDKILFVEYVSKNNIKKVFLNLVPVYEEEPWSSAISSNLSDRTYIYKNNVILTSYDYELYIAYISDTKLFRNAYGNLEDPWYIGVLNANFNITDNGIIYKYKVPEFYLQNLDSEYRYKKVNNKKCIKLSDSYIKLEYPIAKYEVENILIYVLDYYTKEIKYAFSSNEVYKGTLYKNNIFYNFINDISLEGTIYLPIKLEDNDIVYASYYTDENYYEYKDLDIKNVFNSEVDYVAIYIKPNMTDTQKAVSHALIGYELDDISIGIFKTIDSYKEWALSNHYFTVAVLNLINPTNKDVYTLSPIKAYGNKINDKNSVAKLTADILYSDLINGNIKLPTNDVLIANVNLKRMINSNMIRYNFNEDKIEFDTFSKNFIDKIHDVISKNLDVSTFPIIDINNTK